MRKELAEEGCVKKERCLLMKMEGKIGLSFALAYLCLYHTVMAGQNE